MRARWDKLKSQVPAHKLGSFECMSIYKCIFIGNLTMFERAREYSMGGACEKPNHIHSTTATLECIRHEILPNQAASNMNRIVSAAVVESSDEGSDNEGHHGHLTANDLVNMAASNGLPPAPHAIMP